MLLVVDPSVIQHASASGGEMCRECLKVIANNNKIKIATHSEWAVESYTKNSDDMISNWRNIVRSSGRFVTIKERDKHESDYQISPADASHTYILVMAKQADNVVLYCTTLSATCDRFSKTCLDITWLRSHVQDPIGWLANAE